ncbi:MAG: DUF4876 domain-containing protein [Bacteroidales bacterium]|nr:DUF4876 domain-containing protein [Bacteroidales bacterium]
MKANTLTMAAMVLAAATLLLGGCKKEDEKIKYVTQELRFDLPEDLTDVTSASINLLVLKNLNTAEEYNIMQPMVATSQSKPHINGALYATKTAEPLRVKVTVPEGLYNITMEGVVLQPGAAGLRASNIKAYAENVSITESDVALGSKTLTAFVSKNINSDGGWLIAEIFFAGTETPEGKQYTGDKYFRIYNNSNDTLLADGLCIAESALLSNGKNDYTPDPINSGNFPAAAIYRVPIGVNHRVAPGESILLVDNAIDHTAANSNSFNLTKADYEWYDESSNPNVLDVDNPDVPNMEKIYCYTATIWGPTVQGNRAYALCRLGNDEANQLGAEQYVADYKQIYSYDAYNPTTGEFIRTMSFDYWNIPHSWILDAVNCCPSTVWEWNLFPPQLDMGYTYVASTGQDKTRYGKSVRRKVQHGKILQDTNNSGEDFLTAQTANPYYQFH